jgi:hypothetical protein
MDRRRHAALSRLRRWLAAECATVADRLTPLRRAECGRVIRGHVAGLRWRRERLTHRTIIATSPVQAVYDAYWANRTTRVAR